MLDVASGETLWSRQLCQTRVGAGLNGVYRLACTASGSLVAATVVGCAEGADVDLYLFDATGTCLWHEICPGCNSGLSFVGERDLLVVQTQGGAGARLVATE
ncbi:MAG: hypothetical protein PVF43_05495, partial [Candidatus Eiseniibacteriota bacterium]|jgi:hypothetical protein